MSSSLNQILAELKEKIRKSPVSKNRKNPAREKPQE